MLVKNYFAAANGYNGFRSYFGEIFKSEKFKRIYVLKGGPGTGKSSLMKRIAKESLKHGANHDKIYCSSDPRSLDGVIVHTQSGDCAIIDGTAPHERDAIIPGAIDTIINIGDNFNNAILRERRNEILRHTKDKKDAYINAYTLLKSAGAIAERINRILKESLLIKEAEALAESLLHDVEADDSKSSIALIHAFCKDGKCQVDNFSYPQKRVKIDGSYGEEYIFLNIIRDKSRQNPLSISYDPLDEKSPDGLLVGDTFFYASETPSSRCINTADLLIDFPREMISALHRMRATLLSEAQMHFNSASKSHFMLESLYSDAVNFERNDMICDQIIKEIF